MKWNYKAFVGISVSVAATILVAHAASPTETPARPSASHTEVVGGPPTIRRLTQGQYRNVIAEVFGTDIRLGGRFEPEMRVGGLLAIGAGQASVTGAGIEQFDRMGRSIARQVLDERHRGALVTCKPKSPTDPDAKCAKKVLGDAGRLLFRRPLFAEELDSYVSAAARATTDIGDFYEGLAVSLGGMLTSPQFLYRFEATSGEPDASGRIKLTPYSLAERLSFLLWDSLPDAALLAAAESGELGTDAGLHKQVDRMLASPLLERGVRAYFGDMLHFDAFDSLTKDSALYPKYTYAMAEQAQEQTLRTIVDVMVRDDGDYRDLFTTRKTYLTTRLGSLYRVPVPSPDGLVDTWTPYEFSEATGHSGILTQVSFVGLHSHPGRTSPTLRGKALREILMCQTVPDPPGNVDFKLVQDINNPAFKTMRQRLSAHNTEPMCKGCHKITDPMGFALESFDTIGAFRSTENGAPIDTSGELSGNSFADARGLGRALRDDPQLSTCLVKKVYSYAVGRSPTKSETNWLKDTLQPRFEENGYRWRALMRDIVTSEPFVGVLPASPAGTLTAARTPSESSP